MAFAAAETAAGGAANEQGFIGLAGLSGATQLASAATSAGIGGLLANIAISQQGIYSLGLAGPLPGLTPYNLAYNAQAATITNALIGQLGAIGAAQAFLGLGGAAQLANSGRRFLLSTYYSL